MKKFISKASFFIIPFIVLYTLNVFIYNQHEGDLALSGYLYYNPSPKSKINSHFKLNKPFTLLSEVDLTTKKKFRVVTIGDSFSAQDSLGYQNFLENKGVSVLHIDHFISEANPLQSLVQLLNSDFFDSISVDYVILQSVERYLNLRTTKINFNSTIELDTLLSKINDYEKKTPNYDLRFFSEATVRIPLTNIQYYFKPNPKYSEIYKYNSKNSSFFTNEPSEMLFYKEDIELMDIKNDSLNIIQSIKVIEDISAKAALQGIKLIMLVSPDKYDLYYPFLKDYNILKKPLFFKIYQQTRKQYIDINSYKILSEKINSKKDIYFYDDTHWSPKGAKIISDEIFKIINKQNKKAQ